MNNDFYSAFKKCIGNYSQRKFSHQSVNLFYMVMKKMYSNIILYICNVCIPTL
jgi:hypothetical protein